MEAQYNDSFDSTTNIFDQHFSILLISNSNLGLPINDNPNNNNVHHPHQLVSTNSFELNTATSLSEDSGLPHTSSSISSGDSIRVELCKYELEVIKISFRM